MGKKKKKALQKVSKEGTSLQFSSIAQSCLTLCDPMNHSMPGLPVHHHLPKFTQTQRLSRVLSNTTLQKHQFFGAQFFSQFNSHIHT